VKSGYALAFILGSLSGQAAAAAIQVHVKNLWQGHSSFCSFSSDEMRMSVSEGSRVVAVHRYCSAYVAGSARIVTDAGGGKYIFLRHSIGHGTHASLDYMTIYRFNGGLVKLGRLLIRYPLGNFADATYDYAIRKPRRGGLRFVSTVSISGKKLATDSVPPPATKLQIDVR